MNSFPFFSIITPVYNCQKYLHECIQSVFQQTYSSWELILIDDGSTDRSGKICDEYRYDPRILVIHQNNEGSWMSRLNGIERARGSYILGLDSDDYLEPNCLETIKNAIDISNSDLIFYGTRCVGNQHGIIRSTLSPQTIYSKKEIIDEVILTTNHALWNKAIKTEPLKRARHLRTGRKLGINTDYVTVIPILCEIDTGYVIKDILYNYRIRKASSSHSCRVSDIYDIGYTTAYVIHTLSMAALLDARIREQIYLAYLKMIGGRIQELFSANQIDRKDCRKIHSSKVYVNSVKVEKRKSLNKRDYYFLKLFRYKQYWLIHILTKILNGMSRLIIR